VSALIALVLLVGADGSGTTNLSFLKIGQGARAAAMGEAYIGLADDVSAIYWNPAGLGRLRGAGIGICHQQWFGGTASELVDAGIPFAGGAIGVGLVYQGSRGNELRDNQNQLMGTFTTWSGSAAIGYAHPLGRKFDVGGSAKVLGENLYTASGTGAAFDLGLQYRPSSAVGFGLVARNMGSYKLASEPSRLPADVGLGISLSQSWFAGGLDVVMPFNEQPSVRVGVDFRPARVLALRLGYRTGPVDLSALGAVSGLTAGIGVKAKDLTLDYCVQPYGKLGVVHRIGLEAIAQRKSRPEEPEPIQGPKPAPSGEEKREIATSQPSSVQPPTPKEETKPPAQVVVTPRPEAQPRPATGEEVKPEGPARFPPRLTAVPSFVELGKRNSALDAGERGYVVIAVANNGKGAAKNLRVKVEPISSMSGITVGAEQSVGLLPPGARDSVRVQLDAAADMKDQEVRFRVSVIEPTFGADAPPAGITITAKGLEPPELYVYDKGITDDAAKTDYTDGNGDGRWEIGEMVEVTFGIQNRGTGQAEGALVDIAPSDPNVVLMGDKSSYSLGDLGPSDYRLVKCPVYVNPRYQGSQVNFVLKLSDQRPEFVWSDTVVIPLNQQVAKASEVVVAPKVKGEPLVAPPPSLTDSLLIGIPKGSENPDAIAVVIGVTSYRSIASVEYASQDARAMRGYLVEAFGYQDVNVWGLDDPSKADLERVFGTAGNPEGQLFNAVSRKPNQCDVFAYYVGHGAPSIKDREGYLAPADVSPDYVENTGYPLDLFYANLGKVPARSLTIVVDACFSGETPDVAGRVTSFLRNASPLVVAPVTEELPANATVMTAASGSQIASWFPEKKHSLFTYYLLKGLKGEADADRDGTIKLSELQQYVSTNVPPTARALYGREQTPEVRGKADAEVLRVK